MISLFRWLRSVFRIEWRTMVAHPMRTLLVVALIGLPVAAIVSGSNLLHVTSPTPNERTTASLGIADLRIGSSAPLSELESKLPIGSELEPAVFGREQLIVNALRLSIVTYRVNLDGIARGTRQLVDGRAPTEADEIAMTPELLTISKREIADSIQLESGEKKIVGVFEDPEALEQLAILYTFSQQEEWQHTHVLVKLPPNSDAKKIVADSLVGLQVTTRDSALRGNEDEAIFVFVIGFFALAEAALIVSAAFIVGIRRRQREIGLLASTGATRFQVMTSVLSSALLTSIVAGIAGLAVGLLVALVAHPFLDEWNLRRNGDFEICWGRHFLAVALGMLTAIASAIFPAIATSRIPVKVALSSRRPAPGGALKWVIGGTILVLIGFGMVVSATSLFGEGRGRDRDNLPMLAIMSGSILGVVGFGICSPWILSVAARFSSRLPLPWRLAVRETGRFRTRNGPIVTAIVAGMALSVLFATIFQSVRSLDSNIASMFQKDQILVSGPASKQAADKIATNLNGVAVARLEKVASSGRSLHATLDLAKNDTFQIAVDDGNLLAAAGIADAEGQLNQALDEGKIVSLTPTETTEVDIFIRLESENPLAKLSVVSIAGDSKHIGPIGFVISRRTLETLGWQTRDGIMGRSIESWLVRMNQPVDEALLDRAATLTSSFPQTTVAAQLNFTTDRSQLWSFFLVSLLTGLVVIGIATALASAEAKSDQRLLATVGAPPSVSRHQSAARSAFLALLGSVLAVPAGMLPAYGLISTIAQLDFAVPWIEIIVVAIGLPIIAYAVTWLFSLRTTMHLSGATNK